MNKMLNVVPTLSSGVGRRHHRPDGAHQDQSLFERRFGNRFFIVVIGALIVAVLSISLIGRVDKEMQYAEKAHFEMRLSELQSAVLLIQASLVAKDSMSDALKFVGANPMSLLDQKNEHGPINYLGEMSLSDADIEPGNWIFDPQEKVIAYLPFENSLLKNEGKWLKFKVVALFSNEKNNFSQAKRGMKNRVKGLWLKGL